MPFYEVGDQQAVDADKRAGVKNRCRWAWLTENNDEGIPLSTWCQKAHDAGACYCTPSNDYFRYSSIGALPENVENAFRCH